MSETTIRKPVRKPGDRIRFDIAPGFFKEKMVFKGTIVEVINPPDGATYYHVNAWIGKKFVNGGMVFEQEVIKGDDEPISKRRRYGCHCIACPPPPRKLRKCWTRKCYQAHQQARAWCERRRYRWEENR